MFVWETRHVHLSFRISRVELPRQGAGKGSKLRWHLTFVEVGSRQLSDVNNLNTLIPAVHHHTTTAADRNTERTLLPFKFTVQPLFPC